MADGLIQSHLLVATGIDTHSDFAEVQAQSSPPSWSGAT
jgi:hypothetical protein